MRMLDSLYSWPKGHVVLSASLTARTPAERPSDFSGLVRKTRAQIPMQLLSLLVLLLLVAPVAAAENDLYASFRTNDNGHTRSHILSASQLLGLIVILGRYGVAASGSLLGPLMGTTSVLWLIMRNDAAIDPQSSWMVFGIWSSATLAYFTLQCYRVGNHRLHILITVSVASVCICIVALVQKTSFQGGLVTVVPPCVSFAAYTVAYFFPDRRRIVNDFELSPC